MRDMLSSVPFVHIVARRDAAVAALATASVPPLSTGGAEIWRPVA